MKFFEIIKASGLVSVVYCVSVGLVILLAWELLLSDRLPKPSDMVFTIVASIVVGLTAYDINRYREKEKRKKLQA